MERFHHLQQLNDQKASATFLLTEIQHHWLDDDEAVFFMTLENSQGKLDAYLPHSAYWKVATTLEPMTPVDVVVLPRHQSNISIAVALERIQPLRLDQIDNSAMLIPLSFCPSEAIELALNELAMDIAWGWALPPLYKQFLNRVLLDPQVLPRFCSSRFGIMSGHAQNDSLFLHSSASCALVKATLEASKLSAKERAATLFICFLQHLGRIRTTRLGDAHSLILTEQQLATTSALHTCHLLQPHLSWLYGQDHELAALLDDAFHYLAQPTASRGIAPFVGIDMAIAADHTHLSVMRASQTHQLAS